MKTRHLLSMQDLAEGEIYSILEKAGRFKEQRSKGVLSKELEGKTIALLFEKPSTRTRISFETGIYELVEILCPSVFRSCNSLGKNL